jgi:hypothetical protein
MRPDLGTPARWLRLFVAALALLAGSGVHEALHASPGVDAARPTAPFEAHGAGCEHLGDAILHDGSSCVLCKAGRLHAATLRGGAARLEPLGDGGRPLVLATVRIAALAIPGSLGARAPPVTVG